MVNHPNRKKALTLTSANVQEIITELHSRGLAVCVVSGEDDLPVWANYDSAGGGKSWFLSHRADLEDRLSEFGNNTLDAMASEDGLPDEGGDWENSEV